MTGQPENRDQLLSETTIIVRRLQQDVVVPGVSAKPDQSHTFKCAQVHPFELLAVKLHAAFAEVREERRRRISMLREKRLTQLQVELGEYSEGRHRRSNHRAFEGAATATM